ncbi:MAG: hypothetical protein NTV86_19380 [Planctomycetota bacterium]|nr:hypothetical protein [Planctomycetota bacterium]
MGIRTFATFRATGFPDESQWTASGSPLVPDGRSVSGAIVSALQSLGHQVSEPAQHSFYGWAFTVTGVKRAEWCLLQGGDPWLFLVEEKQPAWRRLVACGESADLLAVLHALDHALKGDSRFSSVQWFTKRDYETGVRQGAETPL